MSFGSEFQQLLILALGMLATGALGGVLAGLLGVGGGIVIVPVLAVVLEILKVEPTILMHVAVATSLATIIPTSISSARSHHKKGAIRWDLVKRWAPAIVLGAIAGGAISTLLRSDGLSLVFAVIAFSVAAFMVLRKEGSYFVNQVPTGIGSQILPLGIGTFSTLMGIGGGTLTVPTLSACNFPVRNAVATASFFGLLIAVPGVISFVLTGWSVGSLPPGSLGYVNLIGFAIISPMSVLMAPFGARIAHAIKPTLLRRLFALFLLATAIKMAIAALG